MKLNEKRIVLGKFERALTEIYVKWSGFIAGDLNIDILNGNDVVSKPFYIQYHYVNITTLLLRYPTVLIIMTLYILRKQGITKFHM